MAEKRNIFLVGPMGAGKSTIGRQLAQQLNMEFFDSDQEIERRTGADVGWVFDVEGEEGFRLREEKIINELTEKQGIVLATGGVPSSHGRPATACLRGVWLYTLRPILKNNWPGHSAIKSVRCYRSMSRSGKSWSNWPMNAIRCMKRSRILLSTPMIRVQKWLQIKSLNC